MESPAQVRGGTRWRRFAVVMVPSVAATAAIGVALAQGALAASFSVSGQSFKVKASELVGQNMVQYGGVAPGPRGNQAVVVSGFKSATITDMCQSVVTPDVPLLGTITLKLKAGFGEKKVLADNLYLDVASLDVDNAVFDTMEIGLPAKDLQSPGRRANEKESSPAAPYGFGQQAKTATLTGVKQTAWATTAGSFTLPNLSLRLSRGTDECFTDAP
ncbi:DUF6230 family protein [Streptomyces sp. SID3212]|uniref:DUF6230 family protein n=1 Tax=Streptomyces sp. SID3212 TaxID=2690259 RepID=UPI0013701B5F|nr:DUF6230 family protein [Streptomyces sp. SID3212]MYV51271.1 cholesterol esterase [Streptomyces sp. SID3212]